MDTNQQPKAAHLAQELKAGEWSPNILQNEVALRQCAAEELLRLHAENSTLQSGYDAARLEIESLQARLQELGQMARECSDRKVVQLESALAMHVRSGKDWAMRVEALERTITTLRAHIASLNAQVAAEKKAMRELEAQVAAVGAGGVEPLRKRECLHQIIEPAPSEWDVRGHLAESLTCWPRLTGQEASELVELLQGRPEQADAPVVLPAPDAVLRFERSTAGKENEMPSVVSCNWLPDGEYKLYTEQQVRTLLATGGQAQAVPNGWREQFATEVYADLEAADNQDVPLEEYPARILKVLDSTVGPRHPVVIKWRNDAIEQCIAIARKYCRDPESHKYLKQDLEAMLTAEPAPQAQAAARGALTPAARDVLAERARQISAEGWTPERDDSYSESELALAAASYASAAGGCAKDVPQTWPWAPEWWKPAYGRRDLEKAGALILAEIERIDRAAIAAAAPKLPAHEPLRCSCHTCWPIAADDHASTFMRLCPACGNKRCPKANDHRHACTGSNEPGQHGSAYPAHGITAAQKGCNP